MEIFPNETVLTYTSPNGIVYNKELIPKEKAPKNYADLIDPKLSPTWAGKIAIHPYGLGSPSSRSCGARTK